MRHEFNLQPITRNSKPLVFGWDSSTGELWGPDAATVTRLVDFAIADGSVGVEPFPASMDIKDPLRNEAEMAAILGSRWILPDSISRFYPKIGKSEISDDSIF
jgi:hypothetical protein